MPATAAAAVVIKTAVAVRDIIIIPLAVASLGSLITVAIIRMNAAADLTPLLLRLSLPLLFCPFCLELSVIFLRMNSCVECNLPDVYSYVSTKIKEKSRSQATRLSCLIPFFEMHTWEVLWSRKLQYAKCIFRNSWRDTRDGDVLEA